MSPHNVDSNLLFGFLALQNNFLSREDLIAAVSAWLADGSQPLREVLKQRRLLAEDEFVLIAALAAKHLERHGNDAEKTLVALAVATTLREDLIRVGDARLEPTVVHLCSKVADPDKTLSLDLSKATSSRYRVMRPYARGGLGQVYVAKDTELNRDVALKEIQIHHADDPESRLRFVLEAEITGGLEHPGVVPVYGLGQYADGRPFYAMKFIRGESLAEAIQRYHKRARPSDAYDSVLFRNLVNRFVAVCNAMEYAHSRGVVHRDLKPANIMLGKFGETLVVDWGLASAKGSAASHANSEEGVLMPRSGSGSVTQMGSAIGTPAFMSPEQALGKVDQIGPASDVYSLGATLYSLLTGRAPFRTKDTGEILRKVEKGEFPPPREVEAAIPKPLEAICLKAMALQPRDRYAGSAAMAADLECWLADEPTTAYRETSAERWRRWSRRHRGIVRAVATAIVIVAITATAAALAVNGARQRETIAKQQAQQFYLVGQGYLDRWFPAVNEVLRYLPRGAALRERLLESAATDYARLAALQSADPRLELERGRTMLRLGEAQRDLGKFAKAESAFRLAEAHFDTLAQKNPNLADAALVEQGRARNRIGAMLEAAGNPGSLAMWRSTAKLLSGNCSNSHIDADRRLVLASAHISVAECLEREGHLQEAQGEVVAALNAIDEDNIKSPVFGSGQKAEQLAVIRLEAHRKHVRLLGIAGKWTEARRALTQAEMAARPLLEDDAASPSQLAGAADVHMELAGVLRQLGFSDGELEAYATAIPTYRRLNDAFPDQHGFGELLSFALLDRSQLLLEIGRPREAALDLTESRQRLMELTRGYPEVDRYRYALAVAMENTGRWLHLTGDDAQGCEVLQKAIEVLDKLNGSRPDIIEYGKRAAVARIQLARALASRVQAAAAESQFDAASSQLQDLRSVIPEQAEVAVDEAWLHVYRGGFLWDRGDKTRATQELRQAIELWTEIAQKWPAPVHDRALAELLCFCPAEELRDANRALPLAKRAYASSKGDAGSICALAGALYRAQQPKEALVVTDQANTSIGRAAKNWFLRAMILHALSDPVAAQQSFDRGLAELRETPGDNLSRRLAKEAAELIGLPSPDKGEPAAAN